MHDDVDRDRERFCRLVSSVYGDGGTDADNVPARDRDLVRRLVGDRGPLPEECSITMGLDGPTTYDEAARRLIVDLEIAP